MGMFDYVRCRYPLPLDGANDLLYQTKDTPSQFMDNYEIREDGTLWHEVYEIEDQSEAGAWLAQNPGKTHKDLPKEIRDRGLGCYSGMLTRVNEQWIRTEEFIGEICFYASVSTLKRGDERAEAAVYIEWSAYFEHGKLVRLNRLLNR